MSDASVSQLIPRVKSRFTHYHWVLLILQIGLVYLFCILESPLIFILIVLAAIAFLYSLFEPTKMLALLFLYVCIFPIEVYRYEVMPVSFSFHIVRLLLLLILLYIIYMRLVTVKHSLKLEKIDYFLFTFLALSCVAAVNGFLRAHSISIILQDFEFLFFYLIYFAVIFSITRYTEIKLFYWLLIFATGVIAFEYLYIAVNTPGAGFARIIGRQVNMALLAVPFLISYVIFSKIRWRKVFSFALLLVILFLVLLSQQRAIWVALLIAAIIEVLISSIYIKHKWFLGVSFIAILTTVIGGLILTFVRLFGQFAGTALSLRFMSLGRGIFESSLLMRIWSIREVFMQSKSSYFLGVGLGATLQAPWNAEPVSFIDNSYAVILWKIGLIGLVIFLFFLFFSLKRLFDAIKQVKRNEIRLMLIGLFCGLIAVIISSITTAALSTYEFIIIWGGTIGVGEVIIRRHRQWLP